MKLVEILNNLENEFKKNITLKENLKIAEVNLVHEFDMKILQVIIKHENDQPINFDQIIKCNEQISLYLDQNYKDIEDDYGLEVSSYGIDKYITDFEQLKKLVNEKFYVETNECFENDLDSFQGTLTNIDNNNLFWFNFFIKGRPKKLDLSFDQIKKIKHLAK